MRTMHFTSKYIFQRMGTQRSVVPTSRDSVALSDGPASNSVVMGGYRCPEPRNEPSTGSQIDEINIKTTKL